MSKQAVVMIMDLYKGGHPTVIDKIDYTGQPLKELLVTSLLKYYKEEDLTAEQFLESAQGVFTSVDKACTLAGEETSYTIVIV